MIEIKYDTEQESYFIETTGKVMEIEEAKRYFGMNGHKREAISFALPNDCYKTASEIAKEIEEIFDKKERTRQQRFRE